MVALRRRWLAMLMLLACVLLGSASAAAGARSIPAIGGNVDPALDVIDPGTVGVVASGAPIAGVVPVIVQNRKTSAVTQLRISARGVDGDGRTVARATTRTVVPSVLERDSLGFARIDFHDRLLPLGLTFEFVVTSEPARNAPTVALDPAEFRLSPPLTGQVAQTLDVTLQNSTSKRLRGPVRVAVMCFGESRRPVLYTARTVRAAHVAPGGSMSTRVDFDELCPAFVIGANAISAR